MKGNLAVTFGNLPVTIGNRKVTYSLASGALISIGPTVLRPVPPCRCHL